MFEIEHNSYTSSSALTEQGEAGGATRTNLFEYDGVIRRFVHSLIRSNASIAYTKCI